MKRKKPGLVKSEEEWIQMKDHILKSIETAAGETGRLLELALGDEVLEDKMGGLYAQVARAGFRMRDGIHDVDRLIKSTNLQFTSNLEDLRDYASIIRLKSFEASSIQELYRCFRVLWHAIAHKLATSHGKNNPFIIRAGNSIESALLQCHELESLPSEGEAISASTIAAYRDDYGVDWERSMQKMEDFVPKSTRHPLMKVAPEVAGPSRHSSGDQSRHATKRPSSSSGSSEDYIDAAEEYKPKSPPRSQVEPPHVAYMGRDEYTRGDLVKGKEKVSVRGDEKKKHKRDRKE